MEGIIGQLLHMSEDFTPASGERCQEYWADLPILVNQVVGIVVVNKSLTYDELYIPFQKIMLFETDIDTKLVCSDLCNLHAKRHGKEQFPSNVGESKTEQFEEAHAEARIFVPLPRHDLKHSGYIEQSAFGSVPITVCSVGKSMTSRFDPARSC